MEGIIRDATADIVQGAPVPNVLREILPLASCSRDFGCVRMLAKGCVTVTLGHLTVLAVMFALCVMHTFEQGV